MKFNRISIIGLGYIGLPTAAMFASKGIEVVGVDIDKNIVDTINKGKIHIIEPGLEKMVKKAVNENLLSASLEPKPADAFLIAVPTPFKNIKSKVPEPDLKYIKKAAEAMAPVLKNGDLIILESTSPVGTTEKLLGWLRNLRQDLRWPKNNEDVDGMKIAYCPERVLPGKVILELVTNNRIIGGINSESSLLAIKLYKHFVEGEFFITNARTAEMSKLTENASRDVQIAFANELSLVCDKLNINVWELIKLANMHPRVDILQPGPGVGGHCIAVDPWFIAHSAPMETKIIQKARNINDSKPDWVFEKVSFFSEKNDMTIYLYGIAFKADIDDLRESPSLKIAKKLFLKYGKRVKVIEPNVPNKKIFGIQNVSFKDSINKEGIHVLLVDHYQFKNHKPKIGKIFDTRGVWL